MPNDEFTIDEMNFEEYLDDDEREANTSMISEDDDTLADLQTAYVHMLQAKIIDEQIKDLKRGADEHRKVAIELLAPIHSGLGLRGISGDWGSMPFYYGKQKRLNKAKLQEEFVLAGIKASVVKKCIGAATIETTNKKLTIQLNLSDED